jgi:acetyltransferase-like isoleucine patch superfamily enzyme
MPSNDPQPPVNVRLGQDSRISGPDAFKRYFSQREIGLSVGERSWADGTRFAVGLDGVVVIGSDCYLNDCVLLAELEIRIGDHVMIGWNTTVSDSDFHPIAPAERIQDAIALSPLSKGTPRPSIARKPVIIGDDVFIGPACTILKGVSIGAGAFVEPGSVVTRDVPAGAHVRGNPAAIVSSDETA